MGGGIDGLQQVHTALGRVLVCRLLQGLLQLSAAFGGELLDPGQCVSEFSGRPQAYRPVNETKKRQPRSDVAKIEPLLLAVLVISLRLTNGSEHVNMGSLSTHCRRP